MPFLGFTIPGESTQGTVLANGDVQLPEGELDFSNSILRLTSGGTRTVNIRQEQIFVFPDGTIVFSNDGTTINPDGSVTRSTISPDGTIRLPSGAIISSDRQITFPDGTTGSTTTRTERIAYSPGGRLVLPDGTTLTQPFTLSSGNCQVHQTIRTGINS